MGYLTTRCGESAPSAVHPWAIPVCVTRTLGRAEEVPALGLAEKDPCLIWALPVARYPPHQLLPDRGGVSSSARTPTLCHPALLSWLRAQWGGWHSGLGPQQPAFLPFPCRIRGVGAGRRGHKGCPRVRRAFLRCRVGLGAPSLKAMGVRG